MGRVLDDDGDRLRFRHDLIRDALYEDLPLSVRRGLHREAGLSNPQIGERLYISRRTVQTHLAHVFAKLDIAYRAQLAAEVTLRARPAAQR
jgi:predicted ATPase